MVFDNNTYRDRIRGCLIGGAAGDALGYPVEFDKLAKIKKEYGDNGITKYTVNFNTGTAVISDDTQMTLFTADGILSAMEAGITTPASRKLYSPKQRIEMSMSNPTFWSTTRNGTGDGVPYLLPVISLVLK